MTDIVEKLSKYVAGMGVRDPSHYTAFATAQEIGEAIEEIQRLRTALRSIGFDYVELSYDKIKYMYLEHMQIARDAYQKSFPPDTDKPSDSPLDDITEIEDKKPSDSGLDY